MVLVLRAHRLELTPMKGALRAEASVNQLTNFPPAERGPQHRVHLAKPDVSRKFRRASPLDNLRAGG